MSTEWLHPNPFTRQFTVTDQHIDALGHTNNKVYSQWCEDTAWLHSARLGIEAGDYQKLDRAMVIHRAEYDYHQPALQGDQVLVETWLVTGKGKLTMQRYFQFFNMTSNGLLFQGKWQLVCIKLSTGKPIKMPKEFIQCYLGNQQNF